MSCASELYLKSGRNRMWPDVRQCIRPEPDSVMAAPLLYIIIIYLLMMCTKLLNLRINYKKLMGDEIANVNLLYDDIVHALQNTIDSCNKFRHRSTRVCVGTQL